MIGSSSLGVKVHITDSYESSDFPEFLKQGKRIIVLAFDESEESQYSLEWAFNNVFNPDSDLLILLSIAIFQEPFSFSRMVESEQHKSHHKAEYAEMYSSKLSTVAASIFEEQQKEVTETAHVYYIPLKLGPS